MKQSYNEHIRALADKFRAEVTPDRQSVSAGEIMRARIAVAEMAEAVRNAFRRVRHWVSVTDEWIEIYLKDKGLIPDEGQEAGSDDTK